MIALVSRRDRRDCLSPTPHSYLLSLHSRVPLRAFHRTNPPQHTRNLSQRSAGTACQCRNQDRPVSPALGTRVRKTRHRPVPEATFASARRIRRPCRSRANNPIIHDPPPPGVASPESSFGTDPLSFVIRACAPHTEQCTEQQVIGARSTWSRVMCRSRT